MNLYTEVGRLMARYRKANMVGQPYALRTMLAVLRLIATNENLEFYKALDGSYQDYLSHNAGTFRIASVNQEKHIRQMIKAMKQASKATGRSKQVFKRKRRS